MSGWGAVRIAALTHGCVVGGAGGGARLIVDQWTSLSSASPTGAFTFDSAIGVYDIQARPPPRAVRTGCRVH